MRYKMTIFTFALALIIGFTYFDSYVYADTNQDIKQIQNERKDIKGNIAEAEEKVSNILSEIKSLNNEIKQVNQELIEKQEEIDHTQEDIDRLIEEINVLQDEIKELEQSINERYEILRDRISSYQHSGGSVNYLEVIFGSESFSDFISRVTTVNKIVESDASLMEQLERDIEKVEKNKVDSVEKLDLLNAKKLEQEAAMKVMEEKKRLNEQKKATLESKKKEITSLVKELKTKDSNLASLEADIKESLKPDKQQASQTVKKVQENSNKQENKDKETFTVTATAYTVSSAGGSGITYTGINLRKNPNAKVIAVDPSVIPLGSVVHVEGYGYAVAGDIGGAINGKKIDVFVPNQKAAMNWGVRTVKVTIQ
ncbi:PcsB-like coiled-coil domain-containing protein [Oceanobacillus senegalensis]|uniref:PcsB-like coiled-coil domain-containing protein n=1 Tax=Oceanobacillus senegalensis TaxID=1936063 RepID=UPI001FE5AFC5|nr:3D domain-containing protein [Oceanobacillus senegalensis]